MRGLQVVMLTMVAFVAFDTGAQEKNTQPDGSGPPTSSTDGTAIPNVVGKYTGSFQNKISRLSPMGLAITIKEQRQSGEISGDLTQYVGSCRGVAMSMVGTVDAKGRARMQVVGDCPQKLDVQISGNRMTGDMEGRFPYEISLQK